MIQGRIGSDQNATLWSKHRWPCRGGKKSWFASQEHQTNCGACWWKHYALQPLQRGQYDWAVSRILDKRLLPSVKAFEDENMITTIPNTAPGPLWASIQERTCAGSWNLMFPKHHSYWEDLHGRMSQNPKTVWRRPDGNIWPLSLPTRFSRNIEVNFCYKSNTYLLIWQCDL